MTMNTHVQRIIGASLIVGTLGFGAWAGSAIASADPGMIQEDSPEWDCSTMGNHVCGPDNSTGLRPGVYDDAGVFVSSWPSHR